MTLFKRSVTELLGTFWLVLGGCGSAVLAAAFPDVGIGLLGVALAFGLTVVTMAFAIGHISGCHLNPAVSFGLWVGGRFPAKELPAYIIAQTLGGVIAAGLLYMIASGKPGFDLAASGEFSSSRIKRSGILFALAIGIHNFPEGIATFAAGLDSLTLGTSIALAVAVHNIPEGIAVAVPLYYGTGSRKKALFYSFLSGLAEPVGAAIAMFFLFHFLTPTVLAVLFASVAGIMVFISFDELLPMAERWGHHHISIMGIIAGMLLMAIVLI